MRRLTVAVAAVLTLLLSSSAAWAACAQSDLTGTWFTYQTGVSVDDFGQYFYWTRCTVTLNSGGFVTGGSCQNDARQTFTVTTGRVRVSSACVVTGTVAGPSGSTTVHHAALDRGKTVIMGVLSNSDDGIASFQGVKK